MKLDDVRWMRLNRMCDFPVRYDVRLQVDRSNASHLIEGEFDESVESVLERALACARKHQDPEEAPDAKKA